MALDLYMLGLIVQDMSKALTFYRQLGLDIPEDSETKSHVEVKMGNGLTFFLDSKPTRWDSGFTSRNASATRTTEENYHSVLEFYLKTQSAVEAKYQELIEAGYQGRRAPYSIPFGMRFALIDDPDGNTILLSGMLEEVQGLKED